MFQDTPRSILFITGGTCPRFDMLHMPISFFISEWALAVFPTPWKCIAHCDLVSLLFDDLTRLAIPTSTLL